LEARNIRGLPKSAALPLATPLEPDVVDVRILEDFEGFILEFEFQHSSYANDSWHPTLEEAENEAKIQFGIESWNGALSPTPTSNKRLQLG
jgi:hypothetical protein